MKRIKPVYIEARDIPDAWFQCVSEIQDKGFRYEIEQGSFVGQTRLEFDHVTIKINHPYSEPYDTMLPDIPSHLGIPNPVANGYIEQYLPYLMTNSRLPDEDYTYGSRIAGGTWYSNLFQSYVTGINQIEYMINLLRTTPHTNQAILQVAQPEDCLLNDPPCMRHLDLRIRDYLDIKEMKVKKYLIVYPYFRCIDSNKEILYKVNNNIYCGKMIDIHKLVTNGEEVFIVSHDNGSPVWGKIIKSAMRKSEIDEVMEYKLISEDSFSMSNDHWVFNENFNLKQARDLQIGDKQIRIASLQDLERNIISSIDLFEMFGDDNSYFIRNLFLSDIKNLCLHPKISWKDKKVLPITVIEDINTIPEYATIGIMRSNINRPRHLELTNSLGYFFGAWLANGWFKNNHCSLIAIGNYRQPKIDNLKYHLSKVNIHFTEYIQDSVTIFHIGDKMLYDIMIELGFETGSLFKNVPNFMFNAPSEFIRGVFDGWVDGDTGVTSSKALGIGMRFLSSLIGIKTSFYEEKERDVYMSPDDRFIHSSISYRVFPTTSQRFQIKKDVYSKKIKSIEKPRNKVEYLIDFEVEHYSNFCIGSGNIIVHNSWDLWSGMAANLAAIAVLQKYMADEIGVESGCIIASSKGLHLYGYVENLAKLRVGK